MKFDLADFLELDTKALMAINGGGTCGGGSCSSGGGSCSGGSRGSSSSSYGGSCSGGSYGGSCGGGTSYGGSCGGSYGGSCSGSSYGGSCSGSYGGSCGGGSSYGGSCSGGGAVGGSCGGGNVVVKPLVPTPSVSAGSSEDNSTPSPTEPIPSYEGIFVENSDYGVANAKPGDKLKRENGTIVVITQGDIDLAKAKLGIDTTVNEETNSQNNSTTSEISPPTEIVCGEKGTTESSNVVDTSEDTTNKTLENNGTSVDTNTTTSTSQKNESKESTYGAPTDSKRVTGVIGEKTTHQDAHTGIDIGALEPGKKGDPIYAVADGEILRVGETGSKSSILVLDLPNTDDTAVYQHAEFIVEVGETVKKGDIIGYMSDIGTPGQVHLHFEIRDDGLYAGAGGTGELVNPLDYLPDTYKVENNN